MDTNTNINAVQQKSKHHHSSPLIFVCTLEGEGESDTFFLLFSLVGLILTSPLLPSSASSFLLVLFSSPVLADRHPTATFNKKAPSCPPNPIPVSVSVSDQAHDLSTWLRTHFERREIYHELGNNGLVCVNPGRLRPAGGVRVGHGGRGGGRDRDGDGGRGGGGVRKEEGGGDGDGGRDGDGEEEGDAGSTGDVVKGRERAVNGAGDKGVSRKSLDLM